MPAVPWTVRFPPDREREYLVMANYLPLKKFLATPRFSRYVVQLRRQLDTADGIVGYSIEANALGREYWTLSAWRDADALRLFMLEQARGDSGASVADDLRRERFVQWVSLGGELPPSWDQVRATLAAESVKS